MSFQIRYTDKFGNKKTHDYSGNPMSAEGWARTLSEENGGRRAEAVQVSDPYDPHFKEKHIITVGDDGK